MRLTISSKLFLGFLFVILLNVIYVIIVNKLSDLNSIANILKCQDDIKNEVLRVTSLQSDKRRSRTSFEAIGKPESIENFKLSGRAIYALIDSIKQLQNDVAKLDSAVFKQDLDNTLHYKNQVLLSTLTDSISELGRLYDRTFVQLTNAVTNNDTISPVTTFFRQSLGEILDSADHRLLVNLKSMDELIDQQTKIAIKDVERRITDIEQMTIVILAIVIIVALGFALFFSRAMTLSLRRLKDSASTIGKGNFVFDPQGYPRDEIGDLANAFLKMAMDLKTTQEELIKTKRLAAIGEVVASVNHEINNPLMIISGNAQFLEMSMKDYPQDMKDRITTILEETERISEVTKKLRELKNPVVEDYTSSGEQMINLDKSTL